MARTLFLLMGLSLLAVAPAAQAKELCSNCSFKPGETRHFSDQAFRDSSYEATMTIQRGSGTLSVHGEGVSGLKCSTGKQLARCTYKTTKTGTVTIVVTAGAQGGNFPALSHNKIYAHSIRSK